MARISRPNRSLEIRINRLFKYSLCLSLILCVLGPVRPFSADISYDQSLSNPAFSITTVDKTAEFPVQWITAGEGILAYGTGRRASLALENEPFSPVSDLTFDGVISEALILGKYALLSQDSLGLRMIDLNVPSSPIDFGFYPLSGSVFHLASWGNLLFVSGVEPGIQVFEVSFPDMQSMETLPFQLIERGTISLAESVSALVASDWKLYVSTGQEVKVLDVSDPSLPFETDSLPIALPVRSMAVSGGSLFVAAGAEGLHVVDLSVPGKTETVATYPVQSEFLYPAGRLVYLAAGNGGLHLLKAGPAAATTFDVQVAPGGRLVFSPSTANINVGDTVLWTWGGSPHSTTSGVSPVPDGIWDSGVHNVPFTFSFTFNTAGSFPYFCSVHHFTGTVNVTGGVPGINISITPSSVNFGNVNVGSASDQTITIMNQASSTGALTGSVDALSAPFSIVSGGGAFNLNPGQSTSVTVRFSPTAPGPASTNLSITHNATNQTSPSSISLNGTGVTPGAGVVVSFISAPSQGNPGGKIAIQNTLTNQGAQTAAATTVNFYLSTDTQIDAGDIFIGKRTVKNLAAGASSGPISTMVTIPKNTATGSYFIGTIVGNNTNFDPNGITICLSLSKPKLLSPKNRGTNISTTPTLTWSSVNGSSTYDVQVATDSAFTNIVASTTGLATTQWTVSPALSGATTYFWHVRGVNPCGPGPFSATGSFKTM